MTDSTKQSGSVMGVIEWVVCFLLVAIVLIIFSQVLSRYILHTSLAWSEELARFLFVWLAALGAAYACKTRSHFFLSFLVDRFKPRVQMMVGTVVVGLVSLFLVIFIWQAVLYTHSVSGQFAPGTGLSKAIPVSAAVVGGVLMLLYTLRNWLDELKDYRKRSASNQTREG
ncbi:MAG: TRAP transporter small permease [Gammaproteobacteria bacterium]|nr:TRAP transporter small permease [Gammaproteobacteria bacterium]